MRIILTALLLSLIITALVNAQPQTDFLISFWCGPSPTADNYKSIAEANFNVAGPVCGETSVSFNKQLLDQCKQNGLKALIKDDRILAAKPDDPDFEKNLNAVIADYSQHPALYGYYLADEPSAAEFPRLAAVKQYLLKKDPQHIPYINLFPNYASAAQLGTASYEEYLRQYLDIVKPAVVSYDHYALTPTGEREVWWENLEIIRKESLATGKPFAVIILATPHGPYRDPDEGDFRWQVYSAAAYGAKGILYFTYITPAPGSEWNYRSGIVSVAGEKTAKYDQVKQINAELKTIGKILTGLKSTAVYHFGKLPAGTIAAPQNSLVISKDEDLLAGEFADKTGARYVLVVNRRAKEAREIIFSIRKAKKLVEMTKDGKNRVVGELEYGYDIPVRARFLSGEGKLFKIIE